MEISTKNSPTGHRMLTKPYPKDNEPRTMALPEDLFTHGTVDLTVFPARRAGR